MDGSNSAIRSAPQSRWQRLTAPIGFLLLASMLTLAEPEARFFRVTGRVPLTFIRFSPDGYVTWTNAPTDVGFTIETASSLLDPVDWQDWVQSPASNTTTTLRLFDPNPPLGMVLIPAGSFQMGDSFAEAGSGELPVHPVFVSAFYVDKTEVTKELWDGVTVWSRGNGYDLGDLGEGKAPGHPVQNVSWHDVVKWCNARSEMTGRMPAYYTNAGLTEVYKTGQVAPFVKWGAGYQLPTEAEWEKAARGGTSGSRFPWADTDTITHSRANYNSAPRIPYDRSPNLGYHPVYAVGGEPYTSPVRSFAANGYGLYDMAGNVREWCWDWSGPYSSGAQFDPHGPATGSSRVSRGGSWRSDAYLARLAARGGYSPEFRYDFFGFRTVLH